MENKKNGCEHLRVRVLRTSIVQRILIDETGTCRHSLQSCRRYAPSLSRRRRRPLEAPLQFHPRVPRFDQQSSGEPIKFAQPCEWRPVRRKPSVKRAFHFYCSVAILSIDGPTRGHQRWTFRAHRRWKPHSTLQQRLGPSGVFVQG